MATAKITGTLGKGSNAGTFTISKIDASGNSIGYVYNSDTTALLSTADNTYSGYGNDVKVLDAKAVAAKLALDISVSGTTLTTVTAGKGNDTISVLPGSKEGLVINSGAGRDVVSLSSGTTVTLADFDTTKDVIRFGTANPIDGEDINIVANSGKDLKITLGGGSKTSAITLKNGLGKKITIQNGSGVTIYEDTTNLGENVMKTITDSSAGSVVGAKSPVIDASARKKAIVINASTDTGVAASYNQTILGGAAADSITAADHTKTTITGGKGADVFYIGSDTGEIWITDYTAGDAKTADKIYLKDGLVLGTDTGYVGGEIIAYASKATNGSGEDVTIHLGTSAVWNQVNPAEAKSLVWFTNKADLASISGTAAYANPKEVVITDKKVKGALDLAATLEAATKATYQISTANREINTDTDKTNIINFSNIGGAVNVTTYPGLNIIGSKGKDTLKGAGSGTKKATLDGGAGNDIIIAYEGDTGTGGAGNDTLRGAGSNAVLTGGAGNDVFALAAEGAADAVITDYYSGRADGQIADKAGIAAAKKEYGNDKIVVVNDKYNAAAGIGRASIVRADLVPGADKTSDLTIAVSGSVWVAGDTVKAHQVDSTDYVSSLGITAVMGSDGDIDSWGEYAQKNLGKNSDTLVYQAGHFEQTYSTSTYVLKDVIGKAVTLVEEGTTYQQTVTADTSTQVVTASFHYALAPNAKGVDAKDAKKAVKLVGSGNTTLLSGSAKNDTLVGNSAATTLTGGKGNDVFMGTGYVSDYNADGKDKIVFMNDAVDGAFSGFDWADSTATVVDAGQLDIKFGSGDVTFNRIRNDEVQAKLRANATATTNWKITEKKVTDVMIRGFGTASSVVAAGKGSTHIFTYENIDSGVAVLDARNTGKNTYIVNQSKSVQSIVGSAKNDTISTVAFQGNLNDKYYGGKNFSDTGVYDSVSGAWGKVTVATGKGNDLIDISSAYITDFQATKTTVKNNVITKITGDAIQYSWASNVSVAATTLDTNKKQLVDDDEGDAFEIEFGETYDTKDDVIVNGLTLKGMKGKTAYFYDGTNIANGYLATLSNLKEYVVEAKGAKKGDAIDASKASQVTNKARNESGGNGVYTADIEVIDASAHGKGAVISAALGSGASATYVKTIYAGKGADTVYAGSDTTVYTGAGADYLVFDSVVAGQSGDDKFFTVADYAIADKISLGGGVGITRAATAGGKGATPVYNKKGTAVVGTNNYSDVTLTLGTVAADGSVSNGLVVKFTDLVANGSSGLKISRQLGTTKESFALDYFSTDVTIGATDGNIIDFSGANAEKVYLADNRSKAVTLQGAKVGTTIFGTGVTGKAKANITYIGGESNGATVYGGNRVNVYQGNGASDVVVFTAGNNTVNGGGKGGSSITFGSGNEVAIVKASDTFNINSYTAGKDVIVLDTVFSAADFQGATKATAADNTKGWKVDDLLLTFGTVASTVATVNFGTSLGDNKVTIKLGTVNKKGQLAAGATLFQGSFGTNMTFVDADGVGAQSTINAQYNPFATAITAEDATKVKKNHYITVGTNSNTKVAEIVGGAGNDTIVANYKVATLTGGKGNDTFVISSETNITITDFNTAGKDVLDFKTGANANLGKFKLEDYGENYSFSGENLVLTTEGGSTVTLQKVVNNGATSAIRYTGSDDQSKSGIVLHDKIKIALDKSATKTEFTAAYFSDTTEFDASANANAIKFTAGTGGKITKFVAGKGGAEVNLTGAAGTVAYTGGAGADKVTAGETTVNFSYAGGADELSGDKVKVGDLGGYTIKDVSVGGKSTTNSTPGARVGKATELTVNLTKGKTTGSIKLTGGSFNLTQTVTDTKNYKGEGTDSGTTYYDYTITNYVEGQGIAKTAYATTTVTKSKTNYNDNANTFALFEERDDSAYNVITAAETLFGASEFDEITPANAAVDVSSTSNDEVNDVIKGITATFAGVGKERQDK